MSRRRLLALGAAAVGAGAVPGLLGGTASAWAAEGTAPRGRTPNGWPADPRADVIGIRRYTIPGTELSLNLARGPAATILLYVAARFNAEVERLHDVGSWNYRANVNSPGVLSEHSAGIAIDLNAGLHPNGAAATFSADQLTIIRDILAWCNGTVRWGGHFSRTTDEMHFELVVPPSSLLLGVTAAALRGSTTSGGSTGAVVLPAAATGWLGRRADGRLQAVRPDGRGGLVAAGQAAANGTWTTWRPVPTAAGVSLAGSPQLAARADGLLAVFSRNADGAILTSSQTGTSGDTWSPWASLGGSGLSDPAVARAVDGRLVVAAVTPEGRMVVSDQASLSGSLWSVWRDLGWSGGPLVGAPSIGSTVDGRLRVVARTTSGTIVMVTQLGYGLASWSDAVELPLSGAVGRPAVTVNLDGRMEILVRTASGAVSTVFEKVPDGEWAAVVNLGGRLSTDPVVATAADGRLTAFGLDRRGALITSQQRSPGQAWTDWQSTGKQRLSGDVAVATNADGRLEVLAGSGASVVSLFQSSLADQSWSGRTDLGSPSA